MTQIPYLIRENLLSQLHQIANALLLLRTCVYVCVCAFVGVCDLVCGASTATRECRAHQKLDHVQMAKVRRNQQHLIHAGAVFHLVSEWVDTKTSANSLWPFVAAHLRAQSICGIAQGTH